MKRVPSPLERYRFLRRVFTLRGRTFERVERAGTPNERRSIRRIPPYWSSWRRPVEGISLRRRPSIVKRVEGIHPPKVMRTQSRRALPAQANASCRRLIQLAPFLERRKRILKRVLFGLGTRDPNLRRGGSSRRARRAASAAWRTRAWPRRERISPWRRRRGAEAVPSLRWHPVPSLRPASSSAGTAAAERTVLATSRILVVRAGGALSDDQRVGIVVVGRGARPPARGASIVCRIPSRGPSSIRDWTSGAIHWASRTASRAASRTAAPGPAAPVWPSAAHGPALVHASWPYADRPHLWPSIGHGPSPAARSTSPWTHARSSVRLGPSPTTVPSGPQIRRGRPRPRRT